VSPFKSNKQDKKREDPFSTAFGTDSCVIRRVGIMRVSVVNPAVTVVVFPSLDHRKRGEKNKYH
jgi:hypothetical protein